jgi:hypothetical protein
VRRQILQADHLPLARRYVHRRGQVLRDGVIELHLLTPHGLGQQE